MASSRGALLLSTASLFRGKKKWMAHVDQVNATQRRGAAAGKEGKPYPAAGGRRPAGTASPGRASELLFLGCQGSGS